MKLSEEKNGNFIKCEMAVTNIEYSLLAFLISIAIILSVGATGDQVEVLYETVAQHFTS